MAEKINYQIMAESQKNVHGKYIPDYEKLIEGATCEDEVSYIRKVQEQSKKWLERPGYERYAGFAYNMVYITRQKCGHFEIFQTPCNEYHNLEENLHQAEEHARKMKCTRCISGIGGRA